MKAARSSKKTLLKKSPASNATPLLIDLTASLPAQAHLRPFAALKPGLLETRKAADPKNFTDEDTIFSWCASLLAHSPTGIRMLQEAARHGWSVGIADLHNGGYHIDVPGKFLVLDNFSMKIPALGSSPYFRNALVISLLRALRDIHHENRTGAFEDLYAPEHVLMLERVRAADCETVTVQMAWELRGAGFTDVWRHLLGSEDGDIAIIFSRFLERDPGALFDGSALAYAFRQWYADEDRVAGCDHETLEALDDLLLSMPENMNPFGQKELIAADVEMMSVLPDGICYLAGLGRSILSDPFFSGMNDPVNQTHLFHLMYDLEVTMVNNVPFRDSKLARKIFPGMETVRTQR